MAHNLQTNIIIGGQVAASLHAAFGTVNSQAATTTTALQRISASGSLIGKTFSTITKLASIGATLGATALGGLAVKSVNLASDLNEVKNVVNTTFGENASKIYDWSKTTMDAFGLVEGQAEQFAGTIGAVLKSSGITDDNLLVMSTTLSGLAGDFASFYRNATGKDLTAQESFYKIMSGMTGETMPLKEIGIDMQVANLEAYALSKGIKVSYEKMNQAAKTALRYSFLLNASRDAQGDWNKTLSVSFANQKKLLSQNVNKVFTDLGKIILPTALEAITKVNNVISSIGNNPQFAITLKSGFKSVYGEAKKLFDAAIDIGGFIKNNWNNIEPIILGIAAATVAWNVATKGALIIQAVTTAWSIATGALVLYQSGVGIAATAQWAWNAALSANPIGMVIIGIGALVAAGVWLYKNWDMVKDKALQLWDTIKSVFGFIGDVVKAAFESAVGGIKGFINGIIGLVNFVIDKVNSVSITIPDWVPVIGGNRFGLDIPKIPMLAKGTNNWPGGLAVINDGPGGGEIVDLPNGSRVIPADKTDKILSNSGGLNFTFAPVIHGDASKDTLEELFERFKTWVQENDVNVRRDSYA